jgi:hypothetical protein
MLPTERDLLKKLLSEIEHLLHGCSPGSDKWNVVWPVYESKKGLMTPRPPCRFTLRWQSHRAAGQLAAIGKSDGAGRPVLIRFALSQRDLQALRHFRHIQRHEFGAAKGAGESHQQQRAVSHAHEIRRDAGQQPKRASEVKNYVETRAA